MHGHMNVNLIRTVQYNTKLQHKCTDYYIVPVPKDAKE